MLQYFNFCTSKEAVCGNEGSSMGIGAAFKAGDGEVQLMNSAECNKCLRNLKIKVAVWSGQLPTPEAGAQ